MSGYFGKKPGFRVQPLTLSQIWTQLAGAARTVSAVWTFSVAPKLTSLTSGSIPFIGSDGTVNQDNAALFWDATNDRLGLGTTSPSATVEARGSRWQIALGTAADQGFIGAHGTTGMASSWGVQFDGTAYKMRLTAGSVQIGGASNFQWYGASGSVGATATLTQWARLDATGLGVGVTPGYALDVRKSGSAQIAFGAAADNGFLSSNTTVGSLHGFRVIHDGTNFVARAISGSTYQQTSTTHTWTSDSGLTAGNPFTPTTLATLNSVGLDVSGSIKAKSFTLATLPTVASHTRGLIWVSDMTGGAQYAYSDGTNWRKVSDNTVAA